VSLSDGTYAGTLAGSNTDLNIQNHHKGYNYRVVFSVGRKSLEVQVKSFEAFYASTAILRQLFVTNV
jgi:hypothetical protein